MKRYLVTLLVVNSVTFAAQDLSVDAVRRGTAVQVSARATIATSYAVLWGTLTDYGKLGEFVPGMRSSRIIEWRGNEAIVEQSGEARFLFFRFPIEVTVGSASRPPSAIDIRLIKGNLRRLEGSYRIEDAGDGRFVLRWSGLIEPDTFMPPLIGTAVMRANIEDQFTGMVREIERREATLRAQERKSTQ